MSALAKASAPGFASPACSSAAKARRTLPRTNVTTRACGYPSRPSVSTSARMAAAAVRVCPPETQMRRQHAPDLQRPRNLGARASLPRQSVCERAVHRRLRTQGNQMWIQQQRPDLRRQRGLAGRTCLQWQDLCEGRLLGRVRAHRAQALQPGSEGRADLRRRRRLDGRYLVWCQRMRRGGLPHVQTRQQTLFGQ